MSPVTTKSNHSNGELTRLMGPPCLSCAILFISSPARIGNEIFLSTQSSESSGSTIPSWFGPPADWVSRLPWANWQNSPFTGEHWNWLVGWMAPPPNGQDEQLKGSNSYWVKSYSHRFPEKNILWPSKDAPQVVSGIQAFICSSLQDIIPIVLYQKNYRERGS